MTTGQQGGGTTSEPLRCGCGASTNPQLDVALREAIAAARGELGGGQADLGVVFVSAAHGGSIRPALELAADLVPARHVIGTTAEGVLAGDREYEAGPAVVVWLARLPGAWLEPVSLEYMQTPEGGSFAGWPERLSGEWPANAALVLLADPFSFPVDAFVKRMEEDHPGVPIVGGMASGGGQPGTNTLVAGPRTYDSGAVGVVVGGGRSGAAGRLAGLPPGRTAACDHQGAGEPHRRARRCAGAPAAAGDVWRPR